MGTIRFTSDLHLGHPKVAEIRGFESTDEHDEHLAWRWRTFVHEHDVVYVLGDVSGDGGQAHALEILRGLPGEKRLILGNHDAAHPLHSFCAAIRRCFWDCSSTCARSTSIPATTPVFLKSTAWS